jgi:phosphatidylserine decarboxylase
MVPLTRHGWREMLIGALGFVLAAFVLGYWVWPWLALLFVPLLLWLFAFFRDPERAIPTEQHVMVSPADGTVSDVTNLETYALLGGPAVRVGIFLSVFNVHVNRSPCDGRVVHIEYKKGKFINALSHAQASEQNESNTIVLAEPMGDRPIAVVKQIVGMIARRIIFTAKDGDTLKRGQRIGMIKFGSRTELYISSRLGPRIKVAVGDRVRGGADVIAVLEKGIEVPAKVSDEELEPLVGRQTPA